MLPALPHTRRPGRTLWVAARSVIGSWSGVLDGVLHLLAGVLEAGLGLVGPALGLQLLVVGGPADGLLGLALQVLALVAKLVVGCHCGITSMRMPAPASPLANGSGHPPRGRPGAVDPAGRDQEAGVADHAVLGADGQAVDVPGAEDGLGGLHQPEAARALQRLGQPH